MKRNQILNLLRLGVAAAALSILSGGLWPEPETATPTVYRVEISGPITPSAMESLSSAIREAADANAAALLVVMDTPGGLVSSMEDMIRDILSSKVPVVTYVSPPGAACGSAGVYIMYASHIAAMAPATNIGSATPVQIGGSSPDSEDPETGTSSDRIPDTAGADDALNMKRKLLNHSRAQMRALAEYHGRNKDFAVRSITHAENITSNEAVRIGAIDIAVESEAELLEAINGRTVRMASGPHKIDVKDAQIKRIEIDFRRKILNMLANPNIAMILMMLGMLGIFAEIYHPGAIFPGALGAICLLLGLYAMQSLSVDYTGLALIALGVVFFILEFNVMSYGLLSIGGTLCLVLGSLMMVHDGGEFMGATSVILILVALSTGGLMAGIIYLAAKTHRKPIVSGVEQMLNETGDTQTEVDDRRGQIYVHSEIWQARSKSVIPAGTPVRVVGVDGLILRVEPL